MKLPTATLAAAVLVCACSAPDGQAAQSSPAAAGASKRAPLEEAPPNAPAQKPAFAGQTRAPGLPAGHAYRTEVVARDLDHPWALAHLPDGRLLISERAGRLRVLDQSGRLGAITGLPPLDARDQGGLLGLAVDPEFARNSLIYFSFSERKGELTHTAVGRGRLVSTAEGGRLEDVRIIFRQTPSMASTKHYGGRLLFRPDGTLFVTLGERSILDGRVQARDPDSHLGKIIRITREGQAPPDNPFIGKSGFLPEIWSSGHRNVQAAALDPRTGDLWEVEHGARGGDELNRVQAGKDYGWPTISYGVEYSGRPIGEGLTQGAGMEQPIYYWDPVIGPSGMAFYQGDAFPQWNGSLLVGSLTKGRLVRLVLDGDRVAGEAHLLEDIDERIRDVTVAPDGTVLVATDSPRGRVIRILPES